MNDTRSLESISSLPSTHRKFKITIDLNIDQPGTVVINDGQERKRSIKQKAKKRKEEEKRIQAQKQIEEHEKKAEEEKRIEILKQQLTKAQSQVSAYEELRVMEFQMWKAKMDHYEETIRALKSGSA